MITLDDVKRALAPMKDAFPRATHRPIVEVDTICCNEHASARFSNGCAVGQTTIYVTREVTREAVTPRGALKTPLPIQFAMCSGDYYANEQIGHAVCAALRKAGLPFVWSGHPGDCVLVLPIRES